MGAKQTSTRQNIKSAFHPKASFSNLDRRKLRVRVSHRSRA
jgi:hypothetical protein